MLERFFPKWIPVPGRRPVLPKRNQVNEERKKRAALRNRWIWSYFLRVKWRFAFGVFMEGLAILCQLLAPMLVAYMMNHELAAATGSGRPELYFTLVAIYFGLSLLSSGIRYVSSMTLLKVSNEVAYSIQKEVYAHVQQLPIQFFDLRPAGTIVSRICNDSRTLKNLFNNIFVRFISAAIFIVLALVNLFIIDPKLFVMILVMVPICVLAFNDMKRRGAFYSIRDRRLLAELNGMINESIMGIEVLQSMNREDRLLCEFDQKNDTKYWASEANTHLFSYNAFSAVVVIKNIIFILGLLAFALCQKFAWTGIAIGSIYVLFDYTQRLSGQLEMLMGRIVGLERSLAAGDHLYDLLEETGVQESSEPLDQPIEGAVSFEDVSFAYSKEDVLKDFSFEIPSGQSAAFVGPTGSGKTTVMNLLFGFYQQRKGMIRIDGRSLEDYPMRSLRKEMAIILQEPFLFQGKLYENIALDRPISVEEAETALRTVGGEAFLSRLPNGMDTEVSEGGKDFSAGERQLIAFARAFAQKPKILVMDEATANIDSETESVIQGAMAALSESRTLLVIAHRLSTIRDVDCIFVLDQGRLIESGSHDDLVAQNGLYAKMAREQGLI